MSKLELEDISEFFYRNDVQLVLYALLGLCFGWLIKYPDLQNIAAAGTVQSWVIPNFAAQSPLGFCALAQWGIPYIDEITPTFGLGFNILSGWFLYNTGFWFNGHSVFYVQLQSVPVLTGAWYGPFGLQLSYTTIAGFSLMALTGLIVYTSFLTKDRKLIFPAVIIGVIGAEIFVGLGLFELVNTLIIAAMIYISLNAYKKHNTKHILFAAGVTVIVLFTMLLFNQVHPVVTAIDWINWSYWAVSY